MPFSKEELVERQRYLGASEAAAAVGLSNFFTRFELYLSKIGEGTPITETIPMMVGTALEPVAIELFKREKGLEVTDRQLKVTDPYNPWRRVTLDGRASDEGNVEAKASGMWGWWGKEEDDIPHGIIYQCQHGMACNGAPHAWVPVIIGQRKFSVYKIMRDEQMIHDLTLAEQEFMQLVSERRPPEPMTLDDAKLRYPVDYGTVVHATPVIREVAHRLFEQKKIVKDATTIHDDLALQIKVFMGTGTTLMSDGKPLFSHKGHTESRIDIDRLRAEQPAIAAAYSKESVVRKLLCKIK